MGKEWDAPWKYTSVQSTRSDRQKFQAWCVAWLLGCHRVLIPGGVIKVFGATRMMHRMAAAMEEAGFVLDPEHSLEAWSYGSGFPKSLNVSKALDKLAGVERTEVIGTSRGVAVEDHQGFGGIARGAVGVKQVGVDLPVTAPATEEAKLFDGFGTALKPAWEPFIVGVKLT